jgi:hypothetical protein
MGKEKVSNPRMTNPDGMYASEARGEDCVTLRDDFAGKAMQGFLSNPQYSVMFSGNNGCPVPDYIATLAYEIADEMLKARQKTELQITAFHRG